MRAMVSDETVNERKKEGSRLPSTLVLFKNVSLPFLYYVQCMERSVKEEVKTYDLLCVSSKACTVINVSPWE